MPKKHKGNKQLLETIVEAIQEKKGTNIVSLNLKLTEGAICDYFVICEADSSRQVAAIADEVQHLVLSKEGEKAYHAEGYENAFWVLVDYVDIVVHVFHKDYRNFYKLENLWNDAERIVY